MYCFHRDVPLDFSMLWKGGVLGIIYILILSIPKRNTIIPFLVILWGLLESGVAILQKMHWLESNHHAFERRQVKNYLDEATQAKNEASELKRQLFKAQQGRGQ